ncbi:TPA: hypothetical protein N0F65_003365 [Lagenidium giganteum]|uniref:DUF7869 domain-containing protein n=1 Tax=Lagenidium giganteum TaxID=4803 RepID=A0AAV2Z6V3_9STRA|nr:TPA: hypothetical protein N0F65_003365 [Lagenidium giganteum]
MPTCVTGKAAALEAFFISIDALTAEEKKTSALTALAILSHCDAAGGKRKRGKGARIRYQYHLPLVGEVCRDIFCACYGYSAATIARCRQRIRGGQFNPKEHGNKRNDYAKRLDTDKIVKWFIDLADQVGEPVPVRVRKQTTENGRVLKATTTENHSLLPSYFTWERLRGGMLMAWQNEQPNHELEIPSEPAFRQLLQKMCPLIGIRSPRSHVCDQCSIYANALRNGVPPETAELLGQHAAAARTMRLEYKADCATASANHIVLTMDYAQNKFNYIYTGRIGGRGSNEVISMLHDFLQIDEQSDKVLTVYAGNCGGENKNNYVLKFFLLLAHSTTSFSHAGTLNACDRGFGHLKRKLLRSDCWNLKALREMLDAASCISETIVYEEMDKHFRAYRAAQRNQLNFLVKLKEN